jgi:hypothetical protein
VCTLLLACALPLRVPSLASTGAIPVNVCALVISKHSVLNCTRLHLQSSVPASCGYAQASEAGEGVGIQRTTSVSSSAPTAAAIASSSAKSTGRRRLSLMDTSATTAAAAAAASAAAAANASSSSGVPDIYMWSHCKRCGRMASPLVQMSEDTWKFSFGKFLEVSYYNSSARGR